MKNVLYSFATSFCCAALLLGVANADSLQLKDGHQLQGKFIGGTPTAISFMSGGAVQYIPVNEVSALVFENTPEAPMGMVQPNSMETPQRAESEPAKKEPVLLRSSEPTTLKSSQ